MEEKRKKEEKVRELEVELKRWKNDFAKLETKHFSQTLELKHELNALRSAQVVNILCILLQKLRENSIHRWKENLKYAISLFCDVVPLWHFMLLKIN